MILRIITILTGLAIVFMVIYGAPVVYYIYRNAALTASVKADPVTWTFTPINDQEWRPVAHFSYKVNGRQYDKEEQFQGEKFRNPYAAEQGIKELTAKYQEVHYAPRNPAEGTLELYFPTKRAYYSGTLFVILFYFIWGLRSYLNRSTLTH